MSDAPKQHVWYYTRQSLLHGGEHGPFTEQQILELATLGKIKLDTLLRSPTKTKDREILAESIPKLAIAINQVEIDAEAKRLADVEQRKKEKTAIAEQKQIAKQEWKTEHERRSKRIPKRRAVSPHMANESVPNTPPVTIAAVSDRKRNEALIAVLAVIVSAVVATVLYYNNADVIKFNEELRSANELQDDLTGVHDRRHQQEIQAILSGQDPATRNQMADNEEVDRLFNAQQQQYLIAHRAWQEARDAREIAELELAKIDAKIELMKEEKPIPPQFELRDWETLDGDGNSKTNAKLVDADDTTVTLRKVDGRVVTVPKEKLTQSSRLYLDKVLLEIAEYKPKNEEWTSRYLKMRERRSAESSKTATAPEPQPPSREAIAAKIAVEKAELELDFNGLVLMWKTVSGSQGALLGGTMLGGTITGIVENRRPRKLSYAQISFSLYDDSGAQVGTAIANINGLEPGSKWKFEAISFGQEFTKYKFSELTGF